VGYSGKEHLGNLDELIDLVLVAKGHSNLGRSTTGHRGAAACGPLGAGIPTRAAGDPAG
jgi:hypothetical protein